MALSVLFIDLDAFFASVEQQERSELRGRPTVVVPVLTDRTSCIAASYEAKARGVGTGTSVGEARRRCPGLRVVEARPALYVEYHHRIIETVETCLHVSGIHSIDEVSCELMRNERDREFVEAAALRIKSALKTRLGEYIRCSIGIAPNTFLAKVASKMRKPNGLVVLESDALPDQLYELDLDDLPGIARRMLRHLHCAGVTSMRQLCALTPGQMRTIWGGVTGERFWYALHGHRVSNLPSHRRSMGHSHVLPPGRRTREGAYAVLTRLTHKAAARLRAMGYAARKMALSVSWIGGGRWSTWTRLGECRDTLSALEGLARLWSECPTGAPLKVGVVFFDLMANSFASLPLFPDETRRIRLSQTMDRINSLLGYHAVYFGGMFQAEQTAPMRIAFNHIPDPRFSG